MTYQQIRLLEAATGSVVTLTGSGFVFSPLSISSDDALDILSLAASPRDATSSTADMATLSRIVARDKTTTVIGAEAEAVMELSSAGKGIHNTLDRLLADAVIPGMTSSQETLSGVSAQDIRYGYILAQSWGLPMSSKEATLTTLATSSNPAIASMASAELLLAKKGLMSDWGMAALSQLTQGMPVGSTVLTNIEEDLLTATGSKATWTPSGFIFSRASA